MKGPEFIEIGPAVKLARVDALADMLGITDGRMMDFLEGVGVPLLTRPEADGIEKVAWFNLHTLELVLHLLLRPLQSSMHIPACVDRIQTLLTEENITSLERPDRDLLLSYGLAGVLYGTMTVEKLKTQLRELGAELMKEATKKPRGKIK